MGDNVGGLNFDHRSRHRKVSYRAIHALAAKRDLSSFENSLPSCRTFIDHLKRIRRRFSNSSKWTIENGYPAAKESVTFERLPRTAESRIATKRILVGRPGARRSRCNGCRVTRCSLQSRRRHQLRLLTRSNVDQSWHSDCSGLLEPIRPTSGRTKPEQILCRQCPV
jgi:hypothetical protein